MHLKIPKKSIFPVPVTPIKSLWIPSTGELVKGTWKVLEEEFKSLSFAKGSPDTGGRPVRIGLPSQFYLMLERYEVKSQPTINAELECISADAAKEQIVKRLSLSQSGDDEIIVSTKDVTISVLCPLSLQRIEIPVRGKCCKHFECFDFDTYMSSRPRENPGVPPKDDAYNALSVEVAQSHPI
ncbi:hypothetical protein BZA77DRAFT_363207 [Pyronema omphalodes]|nr:hypothetical protein BZA77DRAFT_363207 [Pyronema omphalodes]